MAPREQIEIPKASDLLAFDHAVAGHAGTLCDASGALFIKPCVQPEISFYDAVAQGHPELADILPVYMGTLMLNQENSPEQALQQMQQSVVQAQAESQAESQSPPPAPAAAAPADNVTWIPRGSGSIATDCAVVLENSTHGFKHPNVLDVKLGQRLWGDNAPLQKRQRMDDIARETTHKNFGFRIAGMRVWNGEDADKADKTGKTGKTGKTSPCIRSEGGYTVYDKDYGRLEVNDDNVVDALRQFVFNAAAGVDADHGRAIAAAFKADLERVRDVLEKERTRMFSSSLLFVFEGDGDALKLAIAEGNRAVSASVSAASAAPPKASKEPVAAAVSEAATRPISVVEEAPNKRRRIGSPAAAHREPEIVCDDLSLRASSRRDVLGKATDRSSSRTDSGIVIDDDDDEQDEQDGQDDQPELQSFHIEDEADDGASISDSDTSDAELPRIYSLRLIDFAHARFVRPEDGPDENNLLGVRKLIDIFDELSK